MLAKNITLTIKVCVEIRQEHEISCTSQIAFAVCFHNSVFTYVCYQGMKSCTKDLGGGGGGMQGGSKNYFWKELKYPVEKAGKIQNPVPILLELAIVPQLWWYHYQIPIDIDTHIKTQWTFIQLFTPCNLSQTAVAFLHSFKVKQFESIETQMRSQINK